MYVSTDGMTWKSNDNWVLPDVRMLTSVTYSPSKRLYALDFRLHFFVIVPILIIIRFVAVGGVAATIISQVIDLLPH